MELYITNAQPRGQNQRVSDFVEKVRTAMPKEPEAAGAVKTNLQPLLSKLLVDYIHDASNNLEYPKKKTIIVLTDGVWGDMKDEIAVDSAIKHAIKSLVALKQFAKIAESRIPKNAKPSLVTAENTRVLEEERPFTIQFIRFGFDRDGMRRLRRLDDELSYMGYPYVTLSSSSKILHSANAHS